jgi:carbamate kinase
VVDGADPAFDRPAKPIGAHMEETDARRLAAQFGWTVKEDAGRGWRRVVASPLPQRIVELEVIRGLVAEGTIVIACGGGGIPVREDAQGELQGVEAVVDKDLASSLLARGLGASTFVVATGVAQVAVDYGKPAQRWLGRVSAAELRRHDAEGQFPAGSMGPKIAAVLAFLAPGGERRAIITDAPSLGRALRGEAGTQVAPG